MRKFRYLLFDLDGTLTDSAEGIVNSVLHALQKNGIHETDREKLLAFVGPPLSDSFMKYYGATREQTEGLVEDYREYFRVKGWQENKVYPGIPEALKQLRDQGYHLIVATSKPEVFARRIVTHFGLDSYFDRVVGSTLDGRISEKGQVIDLVLKDLRQQNKAAGKAGAPEGQSSAAEIAGEPEAVSSISGSMAADRVPESGRTEDEGLLPDVSVESLSGAEPCSAEGRLQTVSDAVPALMIGDRRHDVEGAKENGLLCLGVLYGYGSAEELTKAGAAALCAHVAELSDAVARLEGMH